VLDFIERQRLAPLGAGRYRYSESVSAATLYSSTYAAMARSLLRDLGALGSGEREEWIRYLSAHQDDDGLFRDPAIWGEGWYEGDPLWCGRPHLSCHVITALSCLDAVAPKPIRYLEPYLDLDSLVRWLESRDWGERVGWTGNEIMNIGTLLQYARDFQADPRAGRAAEAMLDWLEHNHLDPSTGVWGSLDVSDATSRSHAVQAAYHWWPLFAYDGRRIPCADRAIDTVLATQNPLGGFGWGVHNPADPFSSSVCEDIDSIYPLSLMLQESTWRRAEIREALVRAAAWVATNQTADGGFPFTRGQEFTYGHPALHGSRDSGAMFPTWFRILSLAYIGLSVPEHPLAELRWHFVRCPGVQFSTERRQETT
jgi:hypothetical protein